MASDDENRAQSPAASDRKDDSDVSNVGETEKISSPPRDDSPPSLEEDLADADNDADLFGSASEDEEPVDRRRQRHLDDEELDSGDDEDRFDRRGTPMDEDEEAEERVTLNVMDLALGRVAEPESTDGQIHILSVPNFLAIESEEFNPETYVAPPFSTASTSLCWRYDPDNGEELQSNARIIRWSDGSLTLQLASNPTEQYRISSKPLARSNKSTKTGDYDSELDSHVYLAVAAEASEVARLTSHVTSSLTVLPTTVEADDAVQRLQESLAAASRTNNKNPDGTVTMLDVTVDPELAKKQAELAEREKLREARKRQMAAERELDRGRRVGIQRTGGAGLTVSGLEGDDEMSTTRGPGAKKSRRKTNRRGEIYSEDEDEYDRRDRGRRNEYDEDDGFLVRSDEEVEMEQDAGDDEEEEILDDEDMDAEGESDDEVQPHKVATRARDQASPKRTSEDETAEKAATSDVKTSASPPARKKNRYIVESDEDE
ncbi:hypothetical protein VTO42DRAFT_6469 [Malbranchea cinnamomea]